MQAKEIHQCGCSRCRDQASHPDRPHHQHVNVLMNHLSTEQRRLYAAIESMRSGKGGCQLLSEITGLSGVSIARGRRDLAALLEGRSPERATGRPGRPSIESKYPDIKRVLAQLIEDDTGGDPMTRRKWVRASSRKLSKRLAQMGYAVNYHTLCRLLKEMGYSMKVNIKKRASTAHSPKRDAQFRYIASQKAAFIAAGNPVISVDTKKKELIGDFKAPGTSWCKRPIEVSDHTFASAADCVATPYGVYDVRTNKAMSGSAHQGLRRLSP